ncbi:YncE family protein [Aeromicrobium sp. UC242_57]|uniref:YncE family protein n=1 Tax=Aeromicrobium sp. UC242_57 TaxID=3374624 RepID=UPI0037AB9EAF
MGQQNKNWIVVSTKAETYGQVVRGPFTVSESNRSIDVDPKLGYVYVAIPARGVEVLDATTGESIGTISGTTGAYYVAADEVGGKVAVAYFEEATDVKNVEVFDAKGSFASKWSTPTRANARQVDIDSTNGLVYVGYTGTNDTSGGFSVHSLATGKELADKKGAAFGKDGYGIAVDEERQHVYVSNRDFRLNPAGEETTAIAINVSERVLAETWDYSAAGNLKSVDKSSASLPAGVAFSAKRDHVFLGDQNGRKIFEIDPVTDQVKNTMTLPENIRDLGIDDENDLLYVGQQNKNWIVVSTKAETYGQVVRGPFTVSESNRSIDVDPKLGYVYVAIPARGVEVLDATTGESIGTISGTTGAYYVAADEVGGKVAVAYFEEATDVKNVEVFDAKGSFASKWSTPTRANARQVDIDSTNGLVYVGYTGTNDTSGGFSVHSLATGKELADKKGAAFGKDGYGIAVDEERQHVYVSNRDFRLNPAGEETTAIAITKSKRVLPGDTGGGTDPGEEEPGGTDPGEGTPDWTATPLTSIPGADDTSMDDKPVGSVVEKATGHLFVGNEQRPARVRVINPATDKTVKVLTIPDAAAEGVRDLALDEAKQELYVAYGASWVVVDPSDASVIRGPFAFGANVRGIAVDFAGGRVFGATRGDRLHGQ